MEHGKRLIRILDAIVGNLLIAICFVGMIYFLSIGVLNMNPLAMLIGILFFIGLASCLKV